MTEKDQAQRTMRLQKTRLPSVLYTAEQTRSLDRAAIDGGVPGFRLMQRAAQTAFQALLKRWPRLQKITLFCGGGNNGGDGLVMAVLAHQHGLAVQVLTVGDNYAERLSGEALDAWRMLTAEGIDTAPFKYGVSMHGELIVDAMLGTGLKGSVRGIYQQAIRSVNSCGLPVLAVDTPSGVCADTGAILGDAVIADVTVSFIGLNRGLLTHQAVDHVGELQFDDLRVADEAYEQVPVNLFRTTEEDLRERLRPRARNAHKGSNGRILVVGGDLGLGGAALIASQAAARCGAGLISLATRSEHVPASLIRCPEVMAKGVRGGQDLQPMLDNADVIVIGPGLGQGAWAEQLLREVLSTDKPLVLDADALNLISSHSTMADAQRDNWVLTPHPGEAGRLLDESTAALQADRFAAVARLQQRYGGVAVLKGAGSLVDDGETQFLCSAGNPGMATGGMGDMLSGIIGALLAQGLSLSDSARLGVFVHATAADLCVGRQGERGLLATDLLFELPGLLNGLDR